MAKKRGKTAKQSSAKKAVAKRIKAAPANPKAGPKPKAKAPARPAAPARAAAPRGVAPTSMVSWAERLRDDIQRSKMTHPDPWGYTGKARGWTDRAERLIVDAEAGRDVRAALDALSVELEGDRDFREARRLF